jgi:hypothetical protein
MHSGCEHGCGETQCKGLVAHQQHPRPPPLFSLDSCESLWSCQQDASLVAMNAVTLEGGSGAWRAMLLAMLLDAIESIRFGCDESWAHRKECDLAVLSNDTPDESLATRRVKRGRHVRCE